MRRVILFMSLLMAGSCAAYTIEDLPSGWGWDPNEIQGTILPPVSGGEASDPNTWLLPIGSFDRDATTNQYVSQITVVSTSASVGVFLHYDPDTKTSVTWAVNGWSIPGPWYIVVDAISPRGKSGATKTRRYTIVGAGYVPEDAEPELY